MVDKKKASGAGFSTLRELKGTISIGAADGFTRDMRLEFKRRASPWPWRRPRPLRRGSCALTCAPDELRKRHVRATGVLHHAFEVVHYLQIAAQVQKLLASQSKASTSWPTYFQAPGRVFEPISTQMLLVNQDAFRPEAVHSIRRRNRARAR